ncbi:unnamed protein product, partial [Meganyctiphanes norvegica]
GSVNSSHNSSTARTPSNSTCNNNSNGNTASSAGHSAAMVRLPELHQQPQTSGGSNVAGAGTSVAASPAAGAMGSPNSAISVPRPSHSRNSSLDMRHNPQMIGQGVYPGHMSRSSGDLRPQAAPRSHSRTPSMDLRHSRNSSADLNKFFKTEIGLLNSTG